MEMASPVVETSEVSQSSIVDSALHLNEASIRKQLDNEDIFCVDKLKQRPNALLLPASPRMQLDDAGVVRADNSKQRQHFLSDDEDDECSCKGPDAKDYDEIFKAIESKLDKLTRVVGQSVAKQSKDA